jgi:DNA polymerase-3 subunit epsilon
MRLLSRLISAISSFGDVSKPELSPARRPLNDKFSGEPQRSSLPSYATGTDGNVQLELKEELDRYQYVLAPCARPLAAFRPWGIPVISDASGQRRHKDVYTWLQPFLSTDVVKHASLEQLLQRGVTSAKSIPPAMRKIIREKRKAKEPHRELLQSLYGACVLVDFVESLQTEYQIFYRDVAHFVDFDDLLAMRCDFTWMGYRKVQTIKPTDIKWLVSEFGEPTLHLSYQPLWDSLRRDAVRRHSRAEIARNNKHLRTDTEIEAALPAWLRGQIEFSLRLRAEDRARAAATLERNQRRDSALEKLEDVWKSTYDDFVVADIETTGLDSTSCEILELAAVRSDSAGRIISEFSTLVRIEKLVPTFITELTGISQFDVDQHGRSLQEALSSFRAFLGDCPVFFHNAPFDTAFIERAMQQCSLQFANVVHDTLPVARAAWPGMRSHKLETLAKIIDAAPIPTHRALADAKTTLSVLLAAREIAGCEVAE